MKNPHDHLSKIIKKRLNVAIFLSGKGSNALSILKNKHLYPNLIFKIIFTENPRSNGKEIAKKHNIKFKYSKWFGRSDRDRYFKQVSCYLKTENIDLIVYAGFMKIVTKEFTDNFVGINIHPADLTILGVDDKPILTGMRALEHSLKYGYICSTVHFVEADVDCGMPLAVSEYLMINKEKSLNTHELHERLKINQEHWLFPNILRIISDGSIMSYKLPIMCNNKKERELLLKWKLSKK